MRDALGNIRTVTDGNASLAESRLYSPYGEVYGTTGSSQTVYGFTGEPTDATGFVHLRARYYNPTIGQFFTLDPAETANRYTYVNGNPVNRRDPTGLAPYAIEGGGGGGCSPRGGYYCNGSSRYYCGSTGYVSFVGDCLAGCSGGQCNTIPITPSYTPPPTGTTTPGTSTPPPIGSSPADQAAQRARDDAERKRRLAAQLAQSANYVPPVAPGWSEIGTVYTETSGSSITLLFEINDPLDYFGGSDGIDITVIWNLGGKYKFSPYYANSFSSANPRIVYYAPAVGPYVIDVSGRVMVASYDEPCRFTARTGSSGLSFGRIVCNDDTWKPPPPRPVTVPDVTREDYLDEWQEQHRMSVPGRTPVPALAMSVIGRTPGAVGLGTTPVPAPSFSSAPWWVPLLAAAVSYYTLSQGGFVPNPGLGAPISSGGPITGGGGRGEAFEWLVY